MRGLDVTITIVLSIFLLQLSFFPNVLSQQGHGNIIEINPEDSIQDAINSANVGDIIHLSSGVYHQGLIIVNKTLTIIGEGADATIIDGEGDAPLIFSIRAVGVKIKNLAVRNSSLIYGVGIEISDTRNVEILNCKVEMNTAGEGKGIELRNASNCLIARNIIANNIYGIFLREGSVNNTIVGNTVSHNSVGLKIADTYSENNLIYHNNFIENEQQVVYFASNIWDNGYPSGGNYWSDYSGSDANNDGIGDKNYCELDYYPLMAPIFFFNVWQLNSEELFISIVTNSTPFNINFDNNMSSISFDINASTSALCRIAIPRQLIWVNSNEEWQVYVNSSLIASPNIMTDENYTYICFLCCSGTLHIQVIGKYAIPELNISAVLLITMLAIILTVAKKGMNIIK